MVGDRPDDPEDGVWKEVLALYPIRKAKVADFHKTAGNCGTDDYRVRFGGVPSKDLVWPFEVACISGGCTLAT